MDDRAKEELYLTLTIIIHIGYYLLLLGFPIGILVSPTRSRNGCPPDFLT
jgi:hypothetical protein